MVRFLTIHSNHFQRSSKEGYRERSKRNCEGKLFQIMSNFLKNAFYNILLSMISKLYFNARFKINV